MDTEVLLLEGFLKEAEIGHVFICIPFQLSYLSSGTRPRASTPVDFHFFYVTLSQMISGNQQSRQIHQRS